MKANLAAQRPDEQGGTTGELSHVLRDATLAYVQAHPAMYGRDILRGLLLTISEVGCFFDYRVPRDGDADRAPRPDAEEQS